MAYSTSVHSAELNESFPEYLVAFWRKVNQGQDRLPSYIYQVNPQDLCADGLYFALFGFRFSIQHAAQLPSVKAIHTSSEQQLLQYRRWLGTADRISSKAKATFVETRRRSQCSSPAQRSVIRAMKHEVSATEHTEK
jgi:hypothetical protein